jgi:hypothetical protein
MPADTADHPEPVPPGSAAAPAAPRRSFPRRVLAWFDPAEPNFIGRALKGCGCLALVAGCALSALVASTMELALVRYYSGAVTLELGLHGPAEWLAGGLLDDHPGERVAYYELLGAVYRRTGRYEDQVAVFQRGVEEMPDTWRSYSNLCWFGSLFLEAERFLAACDRAVALVPSTMGLAHARRAFARLRLGDRDGARADLAEAVHRWETHGQIQRWQLRSRQRWLRELEAGGDPLDAETLEFERERF